MGFFLGDRRLRVTLMRRSPLYLDGSNLFLREVALSHHENPQLTHSS
ncbi:hypothetical protein NG799_02570 [Laspinema sp. D1]|uniref:Uncharacterized protein n=1 Tax=Laspinema palackyanum D2a TaxID=2953684 RepID=A0ABT2MKD8_9CYAN|nr:hypothetical protein [Laspinema sp. D2b]MCT7965214.1 hypothetical protein [Laspinema sp. D2a]